MELGSDIQLNLFYMTDCKSSSLYLIDYKSAVRLDSSIFDNFKSLLSSFRGFAYLQAVFRELDCKSYSNTKLNIIDNSFKYKFRKQQQFRINVKLQENAILQPIPEIKRGQLCPDQSGDLEGRRNPRLRSRRKKVL